MSQILLAIWLLIVGSDWLGWVSVDIKLQGLLAVVTGAVILFERLK